MPDENIETLLNQILAETIVGNSPILTKNAGLQAKHIESQTDQYITNPSVARFRDQLVFVCKSTNYRSALDGTYIFSSPPEFTNCVIIVNLKFEIIGWYPLNDTPIRTKLASARDGITDVRIFVWNDELWCLGAGIRRTSDADYSYRSTQILYRLENFVSVEFHELQAPYGFPMEKNWMPLVHEKNLYLIYSLTPFICFRYSSGGLTPIATAKISSNDFVMRGGTPFVSFRNKHVGLIHYRRITYNNKSYYRHSFVVFDKMGRLEEISEPFFIQRKGIEFACGLDLCADGLLLSYGVSDRGAAYCILPLEELRHWIVI